jgi:two-component system, cell cycle sensor histidine kinase and response regulator CckA
MKPETIEPTSYDTRATAEARMAARRRRRWGSIRFGLASLVLACVLPVWLTAGYLVYRNYQSRRALTEQRMLETARALTMVVDRELATVQASLSSLATSPSLVSGDLLAFYRQALAVQKANPGSFMILADSSGQLLINTFLPFSAPLPKRNIPDAVRQVFATGKPLITGVFHGASSGRLQISVDVPVFRDGRVIYDLAMTVPVDRFGTVLLQQQLPPEWVGRIFDSNQVAVARTRLAEQFVGRQSGPVLGQRMRDAAEGTAEAISFDGVRMFNSYSRSMMSGWTVIIGVPKAIMMAEIWRWLWWTLAGTALLSLTGIGLALLMARRIAGSIQGLIAPVLALGRGESVEISHLELTEFDEAAASLVTASQLIQQRTAEHERAEAARREAEDLKRFSTELERSEAAARARSTELAAIMDAVPAITFIAHDPECQRMTSNRAGYELLRLPPGANTSKSAPEGERPSTYRMLKNGRELSPDELPVQMAAAGREVQNCEYTFAFADGSSREILGNAVPLLDESGKVRGAVSAYIDITERKRAEQALRESEEKFRLLLNSTAEAIYGIDLQGDCTICNPACLRLLGYQAPEDLLGKNMHEVMHHSHADGTPYCQQECQIYVSFRQGKPSHVTDEVLWRADGTSFPAEYWSYPMHKGDEIVGSVVTFVDISDRQQAEQALRESKERFRQVVEGAPVGIFIQTDGLFRYLNPAALTMFGAETADQIVGQAVSERIHPDYRAVVDERIRIGKKERRSLPFLEEALFRLDGITFEAEVSANPFVFDGRDSAIVFLRDITERKREEREKRALEQQLRQALKMEAIGKLAGGIAHDFNNLLMVIQSYTEMLQDSLPADDRLRKNTQEIMKAAKRAASLTRQMLAFSRKQILRPVVLDLNAMVDETTKMLRRLIGEDIELRVSPAESLWAIEADLDQMVQVLMNLCVNARDAMPDGGTLTITTKNVTVDKSGIGGREYVTPGDYVRLSVTDTGTGISKELQERIFDPFFTTKEVGNGTGLGLSTVYGIVKQSGGYVWVESEPGRGACFTVYLPRVKEAITPEMSAKTETRPLGTETILVAEDEDALRNAMCDYLRSLGYTVLAAGSGKEALSVASQNEGNIDLLVTDLVMPGMGGSELAQMLGSLRPDLKTICMSGYSDDAVLRHGIHELGAAFLQKPFSLGTLAHKVRDTLGRTETVQ